MQVERLGPGAEPAEALRGLGARSHRLAAAPPAALTGEWFGMSAVIAPECHTFPEDPAAAFDLTALGRHIPQTHAPTAGRTPLIGGGWFGSLAYPDGPSDLPRAVGGWSDHVLVLDRDGCWWWESLAGAPCPEDIRDAVLAPDDPGLAADGAVPVADPPISAAAPARWSIEWCAPDPGAHRRRVEKCLDAITAGEIYQACVCTAFTGTARGSTLAFFSDAVAATSPARAAYLAGEWGAVASLSPETFLRRHGAHVESSPIKGTAPLASDPALLRSSRKDVAENVMIVDLVRNDLGRVAAVGTVRATRLLDIRPAPGVWHLVSTVSAELRPGIGDAELIAATFPPASVTGTPKLRSQELLAEWESAPRGAYCGAVGMVSPIGGLELNVAIRTVQFGPDGTAVLGVGGGITADSDPGAEWQECLDKAASIISLVERHRAASTA